MSHLTVNRKYILLVESYLFEPKPVNKKRIIIKKRRNFDTNITPILGKRKLVEALGDKIYNDHFRYGQEIPADFFKNNVGHGVYNLHS
jgi:hypothetical protein